MAQPSIVTDLTRYRMLRQRPVCDVARWAEAVEEAAVANIRAAGVLQRMWLRLWTGA